MQVEFLLDAVAGAEGIVDEFLTLPVLVVHVDINLQGRGYGLGFRGKTNLLKANPKDSCKQLPFSRLLVPEHQDAELRTRSQKLRGRCEHGHGILPCQSLERFGVCWIPELETTLTVFR